MDGIEEKLAGIMNDPKMMQQIMSMAQALGQASEVKQESRPEKQELPPALDPSMLQKLSSLSSQGRIDKDQQALLNALGPFLCHSRIQKLEKAMRAAKMAQFASLFLNSGGLQLFSGR